jgi:hypothetical protein
VAGLEIALIVVLSIRGISKPRDELLISNCAEAFGLEVPIPILCP